MCRAAIFASPLFHRLCRARHATHYPGSSMTSQLLVRYSTVPVVWQPPRTWALSSVYLRDTLKMPRRLSLEVDHQMLEELTILTKSRMCRWNEFLIMRLRQQCTTAVPIHPARRLEGHTTDKTSNACCEIRDQLEVGMSSGNETE